MVTDHVWYFRKYRGDRKGQPCKVLARGRGPGPRNVLVEFKDGERVVGTRYCVRRCQHENMIGATFYPFDEDYCRTCGQTRKEIRDA